MPRIPRNIPVSDRPAPSLRANFAATLAGNVLFGASQWAVLSLIAKLGDSAMLGQYALAVAIVTPIAMFSHLNLRAVLATDIEQKHPFGDYLVVRLGTTALGLTAILAIALASGYGWPVAPAVMVVGIALSTDNLSDIYYGLLQRRERMDQIACSMMARGLLSAAALGVALGLTRSLVAAVVALALGRVAVLLAFDRPAASAGESLARTGIGVQAAIFRTALPLGVVLMLISLVNNLPRYVIEHSLGTVELGAFAAVASFSTVGSTAVNALGQAATPRLARHFSAGELPRFRALALRLTAAAFLLGAAGVLAAALLGRFILGLVYRPTYSAYAGLLVWVMGAAVLSYVAIALGYVITSARSFVPQVPLLAAVACSAGVASWVLVPRLRLGGAALALAAASCVQIAGELWILRRTLRERGAAA